MAFFGSRILLLAPLVALPIVTAADVGSVALVHLSVPDNASEAARAGVLAIQYQRETTPNTAQLAFDAAESVADMHHVDIDRNSFMIYNDGSVQVTLTKTAPTLMFKHIPGLRDVTHTLSTKLVKRPTW